MITPLYNLQSYKVRTADFDKHRTDMDLETACRALATRSGWHFRIDPGKKYIYYADLDGIECEIEEFRDDLYDIISSKYGITLDADDFKYTMNRSKYGSFHVSIPRIYGSLAELKNICTLLLEKHPDKYTKDGDNLLDTVVYSSRWFRAPNQLKENVAGTEHEIVNGVIRDFVIEYIPEDAIELEDMHLVVLIFPN